jgi:regulator of replication initiation timing
MEEKLINEEVIKYQEKYIDDLEQQVALLKRTILKQKQDIQVLIKKNHTLQLKSKKIDMEEYPLGYCPYQE